MNRTSKTALRRYVPGIILVLTLVACGGGGNSSGQGNSLAVSTPVSTAATLMYDAVSLMTSDTGPLASISASPNSGQVSLQVHFVAADVSRGYTAIVRYDWDFGDGNTASGADARHSYDLAGSYTVSVTLTDSKGQTGSTSHQIYVSDNTLDNSQAIVPTDVYFFDDFNYRVQRSGDVLSVFQDHGWNTARAENLSGSGQGYLYTTRQIPGYSGPFPGKNSTSVLAIEGRPSSRNSQTDFYLQFGGEYDNQVPADIWFQYWIYINYYHDPSDQNDQMSRLAPDSTFIMPERDGSPRLWALYSSNNSKAPYANTLGENPAEYYMYLADLGDISYFDSGGNNSGEIGQTDLSDHLVPNRWTLVKIHIDTSTSNPQYEQWMKPLGGPWLKVTEYIQGQTASLNWQISPEDIGGHRAFRMPGIQNSCPIDPGQVCNFWIYLDDFSVAISDDTLPIYPY